jgi:hypothetical protein
MTQEQNKKVDSPSDEYKAMSERWDLLHALMGGTKSMREGKTKWLSQEPRESAEAYKNRINRSFLYNSYRDTIEKLVSKPFSRPVLCLGDKTDQTEEWIQNMDMNGRNLTQFSRDVFTAGVIYGCSHILVDFPSFSPTATLADEREAGVRPVFVHINPTQVIGWRTETAANGKETLTQIRIHERRTESSGEFGDKEVDYIRVYTPEDWQLWRKDESEQQDDYQLVDSGLHSFGSIPIITYYVSRTGTMTAAPPMEDLAWLNLAHWQSMSDQRNILRFARVGVLFAAGFSEEEMEEGLTIGPNQLVRSTNADAKVSYVEHNGNAIESGQSDLDKLEERMKVLGLQPIVQRSGNQTATGRVLDESRTHTSIQAWIRSLENTLRKAFEMATQWTKTELPETFTIDINNDFGLSERIGDDIRSLIEMRKAALLSADTFLREVKRRGLLSEVVDVTAEIDAIEEEGPPLAMLSFNAPEETDEDEDEAETNEKKETKLDDRG